MKSRNALEATNVASIGRGSFGSPVSFWRNRGASAPLFRFGAMRCTSRSTDAAVDLRFSFPAWNVAMVKGRLHFDFRREDHQDAALGRLVQVFSKLCANAELINELRSVVRHRDHIAHKSLLKLYERDLSPKEYSGLLDELHSDMNRLSELMKKIAAETNKLDVS